MNFGALRLAFSVVRYRAALSLMVFAVAPPGILPSLLASNASPDLGSTVYNMATSDYGLGVTLIRWIPGIILAVGYFVYTYRRFSGSVDLKGAGH